jgi:hypothetical protein
LPVGREGSFHSRTHFLLPSVRKPVAVGSVSWGRVENGFFSAHFLAVPVLQGDRSSLLERYTTNTYPSPLAHPKGTHGQTCAQHLSSVLPSLPMARPIIIISIIISPLLSQSSSQTTIDNPWTTTHFKVSPPSKLLLFHPPHAITGLSSDILVP